MSRGIRSSKVSPPNPTSTSAAMLSSRQSVTLFAILATVAALAVLTVIAAPLIHTHYNDVADAIVAELPKGIRDRLEGTGFVTAFTQSLLMILVTELGDKTFFIAAVMAMRFSRASVLAGALGALIVMTVLSAVLGKAFPLLFSKKWTSAAASVLFLYFGVQLLRDWWKLKGADENENEELAEVEEELSVEREKKGTKSSAKLGMMILFSPVFLRAFSLTFFAEWGDRSQIATIALAAAKNIYGVTLGGIVGHTICTSLAVVGGRLLATKISERAVALIGGCLFILFAILTANGRLD